VPFLPRICNAERKNIPSQRRRCLAGKLPLPEYARSARDNYHANVMSTFESTRRVQVVFHHVCKLGAEGMVSKQGEGRGTNAGRRH
jgi:hypothetical protein